MTPQREQYLRNISLSERVCRHCVYINKERIKREKRYLNEHKAKSLSGGYVPAESIALIKIYKKRVTYFKHKLRDLVRSECG